MELQSVYCRDIEGPDGDLPYIMVLGVNGYDTSISEIFKKIVNEERMSQKKTFNSPPNKKRLITGHNYNEGNNTSYNKLVFVYNNYYTV